MSVQGTRKTQGKKSSPKKVKANPVKSPKKKQVRARSPNKTAKSPSKGALSEGRGRKKSKVSHGFESYIQTLSKEINPNLSFNKEAKGQLNNIISIIATAISDKARQASGRQKNQTISPKEVEFGTNSVLSGELAQRAITEGSRASERFVKSMASKTKGQVGEKSAKVTKNNRAGLIFSVARSRKFLEANTKLRISAAAPVFLAGVLEYMTREMLETAGSASTNAKRKTIKARHLLLGQDEELKNLFKSLGMNISGAGVVPTEAPVEVEGEKKRKTRRKTTRVAGPDGKKQHSFRPGTVALRAVKKQQKSTDPKFQHAPFNTLVRAITEELQPKGGIRYRKGVVKQMQSFVEGSMIEIFENALDFAKHAGRSGIKNTDVYLGAKYSTMRGLFAKLEQPKDKEGYQAGEMKHHMKHKPLSKQGIRKLTQAAYVVRVSDNVNEIAKLSPPKATISTYVANAIPSIVYVSCH